MSILNRLTSHGHLDDRALAALWTDASLAGTRPAHTHLETCAACRTRLAAFSSWLEEVRTDAISEADEAFPAERLAAQHAQILRRIEAAGRPARVIAFPRFARPLSATTSHARQWVAGAAAAGLLVGVALGQFLDFRYPASRGTAAPEIAQSVQPRGERPAPGVQPASISDEELMSNLEELASPRVPDSCSRSTR